MEEKVFRRGAVASELEHFVEARLHTDHGDEKLRARWRRLEEEMAGTRATPVYLALDPKDMRVLARFDGGTLGDDQPFVDFLREARRRAAESRQARG